MQKAIFCSMAAFVSEIAAGMKAYAACENVETSGHCTGKAVQCALLQIRVGVAGMNEFDSFMPDAVKVSLVDGHIQCERQGNLVLAAVDRDRPSWQGNHLGADLLRRDGDCISSRGGGQHRSWAKIHRRAGG